MRVIRVPDPRIINSEKTYFDADYSTGTAITVINNIGFAVNDIAVAGEPGEDKSEAQRVGSVTGATVINLAASFVYSHNKGATLYKTVWNQVSIERQITGGIWAQIVLMDVMWDATETLYFDSSGDDTYSYRFRFYNSYTTLYSEYSPTVLGSGFARNQAGSMIINARRKVRDPNVNRFTDTDILDLLSDAQRQIEVLIPKLFFLRVDTFETNNPISAIGGTYKYSLAQYTDFNYIHKIKYRYNNGVQNLIWDLENLPEVEFDRYTVNQLRIADDNVRRFKLLPRDSGSPNGYFETFPSPKSSNVGTFYPVYYRQMTKLTDIVSKTDLPFPEILEDYAAWRMHAALGNTGDDGNGGPARDYRNLFYGPDGASQSIQLTGIALLKEYEKNVQKGLGYGKNLMRYRGQRGRNNFFGNGLVSRDFLKENYM
jgi:hypothetical protein